MKTTLVDTCIWSLALRGKQPREKIISQKLTKLICNEKVKIIGPIRQEVLSGYSDPKQCNKLKNKLSFFPNETIIDEDYTVAAEFYNLCRKKGIQGSHIDFIICSVAHRLQISIFTCDKDFNYYSEILPITLHSEI
ncbi:MAG: PIN domain-containing protein [Methylococcales bacterium]|nr:PIN domain-containing protein [Methylococcales bacterium]MBT7409958.1 PIN domain-containing protein [Methylococcales bacterium]